jgi:adenylate cyclase
MPLDQPNLTERLDPAVRLCDEAKPGQILIDPRVLTKVEEDAVKVEPVGEFELKGIRRPLAAYNVIAAAL